MPRVSLKKYAPRRARRATRRPRKASRKYTSTTQRASFKSQGLPKELSVKFPYHFTLGAALSALNRMVIMGNSLAPVPTALQGPVATPPSSTDIIAGDVLVPGHTEYTGFYGSSMVTCSSWRIQFINNGDVPSQFVVCTVPYQVQLDTVANPATLLNRIAELDAFSFDSLACQPYCKTYQLNEVSSGHESRIVKVTRSTRKMIGVKNIKDRIAIASESLPLIEGNSLPQEGWFTYIRLAPDSGGLLTTVHGTVYSHLTSRAPLALEAAAPA